MCPGPVIKLPLGSGHPTLYQGLSQPCCRRFGLTAAQTQGGVSFARRGPLISHSCQRCLEGMALWSQEHKVRVLGLACQDAPAPVSGRRDLSSKHVCTLTMPGCLHTHVRVCSLSVMPGAVLTPGSVLCCYGGSRSHSPEGQKGAPAFILQLLLGLSCGVLVLWLCLLIFCPCLALPPSTAPPPSTQCLCLRRFLSGSSLLCLILGEQGGTSFLVLPMDHSSTPAEVRGSSVAPHSCTRGQRAAGFPRTVYPRVCVGPAQPASPPERDLLPASLPQAELQRRRSSPEEPGSGPCWDMG